MSELKQLKIEEFDLVSFVMQIQSAILQGYEVTDKSEEAPMCIGHCYHTIMREATKPVKVVETLIVEASIDTTKLQEQLKAGGEIEQMLADSLVVEQLEAKIEEKLSTEEFTELANKAADLIDKVDNLLVEAEAKHIEATTPVKATPKQTRGKK